MKNHRIADNHLPPIDFHPESELEFLRQLEICHPFQFRMRHNTIESFGLDRESFGNGLYLWIKSGSSDPEELRQSIQKESDLGDNDLVSFLNWSKVRYLDFTNAKLSDNDRNSL